LIGTVYTELGEYATALEQFQSSLALAQELGDRTNVALATGSIGIVYSEGLGEYAKALKQFELARSLHEELGNRRDVAICTGNIAMIHGYFGDHAKALQQHRSALALHEELGNRSGAALAMTNIGTEHRHLGEYSMALEQYQRASVLFEELGERKGIAESTRSVGALYARTEFEGYDPGRAEEYLLRANALATETGNRLIQHEAHRDLADLYRDLGRWQESHEHLARSHELKEELHTIKAHKKFEQIEHLKQIAEMEKRRAIERAEEEAAREALALRSQLLEVQLDRQRAELASQAMNLAKQTEMLGGFRNDLRAIMREGGDPLATVRQIKEKLKELPCEAIDWTKFDAEFRQTYPDFQSKLLQRFPEMSGMEMRVCALLKLKLTSADISKLLCLSERSVEGHRLHIRRKMALAPGEDVHAVLAAI
jgi:tetratricopeptide (TPR) repeat protein